MGGVNVSTLANGSSIVELPRMVSVAGDNGDLYICDVSDGALQFEYRITLYITSKLLLLFCVSGSDRWYYVIPLYSLGYYTTYTLLSTLASWLHYY